MRELRYKLKRQTQYKCKHKYIYHEVECIIDGLFGRLAPSFVVILNSFNSPQMSRAFPLNPSASFRWYWALAGCSSCAQIAAPDAPTCCRISPEMLDWSAAETNRLALWPDDYKINLQGESKWTKWVEEQLKGKERESRLWVISIAHPSD